MTIFRGELGGWFLVMFVCLLVGKIWGWIGEGRVEILDQQPPANPRLFHARLATSLVLSVLFDAFMLDYAVKTVLEQARPDMMVMFGFEFAILTILSTSTLARYGISLVETYINSRQKKSRLLERTAEIRAARDEAIRQHRESGAEGVPDDLPDENDVDEMDLDVPGWEEKGRWVFYLDLVTDFFKLVVYLSFFAILFTFYGLPIHILRDVVVTIRSFGRRIMDFMRYRNATRDMNERYPDATADEVAREDVCIICREEMVPWQQPAPANANAGAGRAGGTTSDRLRAKKLPCGHILHFACLRSWLERQQNCPTCRRPVVVPQNQAYRPGGPNNDGPQIGPHIAPGANQPGAANDNAGNGAPRARVYQFGPFRVGFGAGRGDLFQNLHQQIHGNNVPPANAPPGAQQIGFGFGFGQPAAVPQPAAAAQTAPGQTNWTNMQQQLQNIEQQIAQEYQNLRATADQLNVLRILQAELERLRSTNTSAPPSNGTLSPSHPSHPSPSPSTFHPSLFTSTSHRTQLATHSSTPPIPAGDSRLPDGLVLPDGWTMLPLQRLDPVNGAPNPASTSPELHPTNGNPPSRTSAPSISEESAAGHHSNVTRDASSSVPPLGTTIPSGEPEQVGTLSYQTNGSSQGPADLTSDAPREEHSPSTEFRQSDVLRGQAGSGETLASSSSSAKGKARAVSVEDLDEDD